jgi:hypothetical protein
MTSKLGKLCQQRFSTFRERRKKEWIGEREKARRMFTFRYINFLFSLLWKWYTCQLMKKSNYQGFNYWMKNGVVGNGWIGALMKGFGGWLKSESLTGLQLVFGWILERFRNNAEMKSLQHSVGWRKNWESVRCFGLDVKGLWSMVSENSLEVSALIYRQAFLFTRAETIMRGTGNPTSWHFQTSKHWKEFHDSFPDIKQ